MSVGALTYLFHSPTLSNASSNIAIGGRGRVASPPRSDFLFHLLYPSRGVVPAQDGDVLAESFSFCVGKGRGWVRHEGYGGGPRSRAWHHLLHTRARKDGRVVGEQLYRAG